MRSAESAKVTLRITIVSLKALGLRGTHQIVLRSCGAVSFIRTGVVGRAVRSDRCVAAIAQCANRFRNDFGGIGRISESDLVSISQSECFERNDRNSQSDPSQILRFTQNIIKGAHSATKRVLGGAESTRAHSKEPEQRRNPHFASRCPSSSDFECTERRCYAVD